MAARVTQQPEEPQQAEENEITTPADLGFTREIEVDPIQELPPTVDDQGYVVIRMAQTIDEFTFGNPNFHYNLKEGHRYRLPVPIARYLDSIGKVYH